MSENPSPQVSTLLATATTYLQVFSTLDPEVLTPIQAPNFKHFFAPASAKMPSSLTAEAFAEHVRGICNILQTFPVIPIETWPNPSLRQVTIWAKARPQFRDEIMQDENEDEWEYEGEYIYMLEMDETGEKIERVVEFLDSLGTERIKNLMGKAFAKLEQKKESLSA